jgi:hypothetical protein
MRVKVDNIRLAFTKAKRVYAVEWLDSNSALDTDFWYSFGKTHNITVEIEGYIEGFPRIEYVTFNTEEAYTWFILRWA